MFFAYWVHAKNNDLFESQSQIVPGCYSKPTELRWIRTDPGIVWFSYIVWAGDFKKTTPVLHKLHKSESNRTVNDGMASSGSVSGWIEGMREGDPDAVRNLVERYFRRLAQYSNKRLDARMRVAEDGEDIAIMVLDTLTRNAQLGLFPNLQHREDLWLLLILLTQQIVIERKRKANSERRVIHNMTDLLTRYSESLESFLQEDPSQSKILEIVDCWNELLKSLDDDRSRDIARLKLQGFSNREIGTILQIVPKTVDRKVNAILQRWQDFFMSHFSNKFE